MFRKLEEIKTETAVRVIVTRKQIYRYLKTCLCFVPPQRRSVRNDFKRDYQIVTLGAEEIYNKSLVRERMTVTTTNAELRPRKPVIDRVGGLCSQAVDESVHGKSV